MEHSKSNFYINRNVDIIKEFKKLIAVEGSKVRETIKDVARSIGVSASVVNAVIYQEGYGYRAEAWAIVDKEENEKEVATKRVA